MPKESNVELKVGVFVLAALLGLTVFIFSISDTTVFQQGKSLKVVFNFANGLKKSAPVRIAGVEQGIIKDIKLFFDEQESKTKAEVELQVRPEARIPKDSVVMINQLGFLGEKYIEIIPGIDTQNFYEEGAVIVGKDPISQEAIAERVMTVSNKLDVAIGGISKIMGDEENIASIKSSLSNVSALTGNLKDITTDVKLGKGTVGKLFYDNRLYDDLQGLSSDLKANPWKLLYRPKGNK